MKRWCYALSTAALVLAGVSSVAVAEGSSTGADAQQEVQIRAQLAMAPDLRNNRIVVHVDDGIAVLEGTVDTQAEKKEARLKALWDKRLAAQMAELPEFDGVFRAVRRALRQAALVE